jgi:hypothetical protein
MNLTNLKFIKAEQVDTLRNVSTSRSEAPSKILCGNCHVNDRASTGSLLCDDCLAEANEIRTDKKVEYANGALPVIEQSPTVINGEATLFNAEELPLETNSKQSAKSIRFAPPSIRYDGKQLDEIAWSMLPALPENVLLEINKLVLSDARKFVSQETEPTIQDIDVVAEYCIRLGTMMKSLGSKKKDKIILAAKPEAKRLEKERKEKEKSEKIQKAIPKDPFSKYVANILLEGIATIVAPPDKALQSRVKDFLDYVQLQSNIEDEITAEWLTSQLSKPKYRPIKQYFKINQNANQ